MSGTCPCGDRHEHRKIVLTGGPGGGKTAVLEVLRKTLCQHVAILPESASVVFGGGFPRLPDPPSRRAAQRAIYFVQRELEAIARASDASIVICDRGTVDSVAYWPGPGDFWQSVHTTRDEELRRYDAVIHLRVPSDGNGYGHQNPLRIESAEQAHEIDERIMHAWSGHPCRHIIDPQPNFLAKTEQVLTLLRDVLPECCQAHPAAAIEALAASIGG